MKTFIRIGGIILFAFLFFPITSFAEQDYPTKPVTMIHGFSAGGNTDLSVRILGEALTKFFNQPFVTVPKPGGGQSIAAAFVARSAPDGYTIGQFYKGVFTRTPLIQDVPYKVEDFKPVIAWQISPQVLVCRIDAPYKDLKELINASKTQSIKYGHNGKGSVTFLAPMLFARKAGIKLVDVPFKGDADQLTAVLGRHIDLGSVVDVPALPFIEAGQIRVLGVYSPKRMSSLPEIPTFEEQGFNIPLFIPVGMAFVSKGTSDDIVKKLHDAIKYCINDPKVKVEFDKIKQTIIYMDSKEMIDSIKTEKEALYPLLKELELAK